MRNSRDKTRARSLLHAFLSAIKELAPENLLQDANRTPRKDSALLCWGKAAEDFHHALPRRARNLVISPSNSDHPIPGPRSFQAGKNLLHFFDELAQYSVKHLDVYLSGGASSLAWLPSTGISRREAVKRLKTLYRQELTIRQLNLKRAKLCRLKMGGAARIARTVCPQLKTRVFTVSDVSPFGSETLGGGPFFLPGISHCVLTDNQKLRKLVAQNLAAKDKGFVSGSMALVFSAIEKTVLKKESGTFVFGCEPALRISTRSGQGGRQSHLACLLLHRFGKEIRAGDLEILCISSDGVDGTSGGAGALLTREISTLSQLAITQALEAFNTASALKMAGALIPTLKTGTNVQDIVVIKKGPHPERCSPVK